VIQRVIAFALHQRFITLALALLLTIGGIISYYRLPIEAYPDVGDTQVDVITIWPGRAAEEVERYITILWRTNLTVCPILPSCDPLQSSALEHPDRICRRHRQVLVTPAGTRAHPGADLPADAKPGLGPLWCVVCEVYRYTLESKTMLSLRSRPSRMGS